MSLARNERELLARVLRWARVNGWEPGPYFYQWRRIDRTAQVEWDAEDGEIAVFKNVSGYSVRWALVHVDSVQHMVDALAAMRLVPSHFSKQYDDGYCARWWLATRRDDEEYVPLRLFEEIAA